ncbi:hypothetical protein CKAN_02460400 [Cinnamomum micranthum f. kanehirae]|uniref:Uncharacterized protein n=1 Tax=Cinnamomum micranthum f. kanehirae TaxID=337451 RepID=A0A443PWY7_9MAGN|nr:hypothetical protein CKAN_02460400 [Cinnamomum micranthum f. kanehirae]
METIMTALKIQNPDSESGEKMAQVEEKKQDNKIEMRISGGGIGGLVILGGVLAAAALVAAFRNRSKRKPTSKITKDPPTDPSEEHESKKEGDGARSVLQTPSLSLENNQSKGEASIIHSTMLGSSDSMATKSLIMEEDSSQINVEAEKTKSVNEEMDLDNSKKDLPAADDYGTTNEGILTEQKDYDQNKENTEDTTPVDTVTFTQNIDKGEENPSPQLLDNNNNEKDGGGSDGTVDSSMESNAEAIWPAKIVEHPFETQIKSHIKNSEKTIADEADNDAYMRKFVEGAKYETHPVKMMEMQEIQSHQSSRFVVLVSSMVGVLLLFLLNHLISKSYVPSVSWPSNATQSL